MSFCLPIEKASKFIQALKDGNIDPGKLANMSSAERHSFFSDLVGEDNARDVNALFESKLLLKNQQAGLVNWAKQITGIKPQIRNDILTRIGKMDKVLNPGDADLFLQDLASKKLGTDISFEQAKELSDKFKSMQAAKQEAVSAIQGVGDAAAKTDKATIEARLKYGFEKKGLDGFIADLKNEGNNPYTANLKGAANLAFDVAGGTKYMASTADLSFSLSQGIKVLYKGIAEGIGGNPTTLKAWGRGFASQFSSFAKELGGKENAIEAIRAEIESRPNALNGKYDAMGRSVGLGLTSEEAFPESKITQKLESIPIIGRVLKGAEAAFNGFALHLRADLADATIAKAEQHGVDVLNKDEMKPIGEMISSLTGRGNIGKLETVAKPINVVMFSVKFLKSNIDTLIAPLKEVAGEITDKTGLTESNRGEVFARREAATNTLKIVGTLAGIYTIANLIKPGSVILDPTNSNFGKIKIGDNYFDPTGKMGSLVVLAARMATGKYTSASGKVTDLWNPKYGQSNRLNVFTDYMFNRATPVAGTALNFLRGKDFSGNKPTVGGEALKLITPIPIQTLEQLHSSDEDTANQVGAMILDALGANATIPNKPKRK